MTSQKRAAARWHAQNRLSQSFNHSPEQLSDAGGQRQGKRAPIRHTDGGSQSVRAASHPGNRGRTMCNTRLQLFVEIDLAKDGSVQCADPNFTDDPPQVHPAHFRMLLTPSGASTLLKAYARRPNTGKPPASAGGISAFEPLNNIASAASRRLRPR